MTIEKAVEHLRWLAGNSRLLAAEYPEDEDVAATDLMTARAVECVLRELRRHCPRARSRRTIMPLITGDPARRPVPYLYEFRRRPDGKIDVRRGGVSRTRRG